MSIWNKEELPEEWKESIILHVYRKGHRTYCSSYRGTIFCQLQAEFYPTSFYQVWSIVPRKLFRILNMEFDATSQLLISSNTGEKMRIKWSRESAIYRFQEILWFS